jgi:hypothetical protein
MSRARLVALGNEPIELAQGISVVAIAAVGAGVQQADVEIPGERVT